MIDNSKRSEAPTVNESLELSLMEHKNKDNSKIAINYLKSLFVQDLKTRLPNVPSFAIVAPEYKDTSTSGLSKCVYDYVRLRGYFIERSSNEGRIIDDRKTYVDVVGRTRVIGSVKRIRSSGTNGTSDYKSVVNGRFIAIEIKCRATNDRIRPDQLRYKEQVEKSGGIYLIVKDFASFFEWFNLFIEKGNNQ